MTAIKMLDEAIKNEHVLGLYSSDILSLMKEYAALKCKEQKQSILAHLYSFSDAKNLVSRISEPKFD